MQRKRTTFLYCDEDVVVHKDTMMYFVGRVGMEEGVGVVTPSSRCHNALRLSASK